MEGKIEGGGLFKIFKVLDLGIVCIIFFIFYCLKFNYIVLGKKGKCSLVIYLERE